jgi:hypothetical protein
MLEKRSYRRKAEVQLQIKQTELAIKQAELGDQATDAALDVQDRQLDQNLRVDDQAHRHDMERTGAAQDAYQFEADGQRQDAAIRMRTASGRIGRLRPTKKIHRKVRRGLDDFGNVRSSLGVPQGSVGAWGLQCRGLTCTSFQQGTRSQDLRIRAGALASRSRHCTRTKALIGATTYCPNTAVLTSTSPRRNGRMIMGPKRVQVANRRFGNS